MYERKYVRNFDELSDEKVIDELLKNHIITIELKTRKVKFLTRNIEKIEIIEESKEVI